MPHIAIAGAGIGGLSAALALAAGGATISLFERRPALDVFGAGLQLSPLASRILFDLGLGDALRRDAVEPQAIRIRRGRDAAELTRLPLGEQARRRYGAPFLLVHRGDLQQALAERVVAQPGIALHLAAAIEQVKPAETSVTVSGSNLQAELRADGFVNAGGLHADLGHHAGPPVDSRRVAWRALIPAGALPQSFGLAETNLWLGARTHLVHYPLRGGSVINVVAITDEPERTDAPDLWTVPGDPARLRQAFAAWHATPRRLIEAAAQWHRWPLLDRAPLPRWSIGRTTLLGDAAHPMLPFLAQGGAQAIEDAGALAAAVARCGDLEEAFRHYEEVRRAHVSRVQAQSRRQGQIYHLRRPAADVRDLVLRCLSPDRLLAGMDWLYTARS